MCTQQKFSAKISLIHACTCICIQWLAKCTVNAEAEKLPQN